MRKLRLLAVAVCVGAGALATTAGTAQAATIIVNPGHSIQAAIDIANPGDTILVRPGVFRETLVITTNRIRLQGSMASLQPPLVSTSPCGWAGVCVYGAQGVTVSGFLVTGFDDFGMVAFGASRATFMNNHAVANGEYGITAFESTGTTIAGNVTQGSGEAGIYIGDSPVANASIHDNSSQGNAFGILFRNAYGGTIQHNTFSHNCAGVVMLADAPGPAGTATVESNTVSGNTGACYTEDAGFVSGVGIALLGTDHVLVHANTVENNIPSDLTFFTGGILVESGPGGTPASFNTIAGNTVLHNQPDLYWDTLGHGNVFRLNTCQTSTPNGLCSH